MDKEASLIYRLKRLEDKLVDIETRKAEFFDERNISLDLQENEETIRNQISSIEEELSSLARDKSQATDIPFVIVAMTDKEATALIDEYIFEGDEIAPALHARFKEFKKLFPEDAVQNWLVRYKEDREEWNPQPSPESCSIRDIISELVGFNPPTYRPFALPMIQPQFCTSRFFSRNEDTQEQIWREIGASGGVLIIDAVSLFHPKIRRTILDSGLMAKDHVAIVVISPIDLTAHDAHQFLETELRWRMKRAFTRFDKYLDKLCEIGVGDLRSFKRWLISVLPEAVSSIQNQKPSATTLRRTWEGREGEARGIYQAFSGVRGAG